MLNIVIIGPPWSGKTTQCKMLAEHYSLLHITTSTLIQNFKTKDDNIILDLIRKEITDNIKSKGFIFEGCPKNIIQAKGLHGLLNEFNYDISIVFQIKINRMILINRAGKHGDRIGRKNDTKPVLLHRRIDVYESNLVNIKDFFLTKNIMYNAIDGNQSISSLFKNICNHLTKL